MHSFRAQHIPALDGLRGLAILLVIIHHQLIALSLKGGFLGVDLFFVLSGFLITSLLLKEFDATDSISLTNFYARRVLRLAPALLLYLFVALIITYCLKPDTFVREVKLAGLALAYLTNWRMALGWDYSLDPTAIIWSLSIEEQFYLLWPPILLLALTAGVKKNHLAAALLLIVCAIAIHRGVLWSNGAELNRMYYGTDTRADAPLIGCFVAMVSLSRITTRLRAILNIGALVAAVALTVLVVTTSFTDAFLYRGGYTFVAIAAGVMTLSVADPAENFLARVFAWKPLCWLGTISYGLYLWHWLILRTTSFYYLVGRWDSGARLICAVAVAAASYYLFERRITKLKSRFSYQIPTTSVRTGTLVTISPTIPNPVIKTSEQQI